MGESLKVMLSTIVVSTFLVLNNNSLITPVRANLRSHPSYYARRLAAESALITSHQVLPLRESKTKV